MELSVNGFQNPEIIFGFAKFPANIIQIILFITKVSVMIKVNKYLFEHAINEALPVFDLQDL